MWDQRYDQDDYLFGTAPSQFLVTQQSHLKPDLKSLAIADGEGPLMQVNKGRDELN